MKRNWFLMNFYLKFDTFLIVVLFWYFYLIDRYLGGIGVVFGCRRLFLDVGLGRR